MEDRLIKEYPKGSDITLINEYYLYPKKDPETGKYDDGSITLIYKDNITGKKGHRTIKNPPFEFYIAKPEYVIYGDDGNPVQETYKSKDELDLVQCKYKDVQKTIAELTGNEEFFYNNIKNGNRRENQRLHSLGILYSADADISDFYRMEFGKQYKNTDNKPTKAYFDIEADTRYMKGDFPELGECPINAITVIDEARNNVYTFLLRNSKNPLIEEFEKSINDGLFSELKEFVIDKVGGPKMAAKYGVDKLNFNFLFYDEDEEIRLIQDFFIYINRSQPDFVLAWNMSFDIPYIIQRIINLGYDPREIMCHPDFEVKEVKYYIDERNLNELTSRGDYAIISSYSAYIDQMIHFASRRKGQNDFISFNLDYIGNYVANVRKYDYKHITTDIGMLPYLDYKVFVFYNIMDTIVQKCIESKTGDIDYVFSKCIINNTRYHKCHRQTVYLKNRGRIEFENDCNMILGNNVNVFKEKPKNKYPGAYVGDPLLIDDYAKLKINGRPIMVFDNLDDFDYRALYPSLIREFNVSPATMIGYVNIPDQIWDGENPRNDEQYSRGGAFLNDFQSQTFLLFCHRWLHFANYKELYNDIIEYFTYKQIPRQQLFTHTREGYIIPAVMYGKNVPVKPAYFKTHDNRIITPAYIPRSFDMDKYRGEIFK